MADDKDGVLNRDQLQEAFEILFGPQFTFSEAVLNYLQPSGIKSAYREQVKVHHPDKNGTRVQKRAFHELTEAYQLLLDYKQRKIRISAPSPKHQAQSRKTSVQTDHQNSSQKNTSDFYYPGDRLPHHRLRFGEFLYYSKVVSWNTLIKALVFKRKFSDQKMGQYFIKEKIISESDLQRYLSLQDKHNKGSQKKG